MFIRRGCALVLLFLAGLLVQPMSVLAGQTLYTSTLSDLASAQKDGSVIASVSPGVALNVIETSNGWLKVEISGWSPQGAEKYLFTKMGQRIRLASITDEGMANRTVISKQEDYYENVWNEVRLSGWIKQKDTTADVVSVWQGARALFQKRCTRCHALHRPVEFKANQWPSILKIMTVRAGLSPANKALVTQYLQTYAKDQTGAPALGQEDAPNAATDPQ